MNKIIKDSKKVIAEIILVMVVLLMMAGNSYATINDTTNAMITSYANDTIVTKENVLEILDDFGIDHGDIIYSDEENDFNYTVADLREALLKIQNQTKEGALTESISQNESENNLQPSIDTKAASTTKTKKLSETFQHDGFSLTHIAHVKYKGSSFTDVTSTDITLDSDLLPIVYKITKERKISATFTKTNVKQSYDIDISSYIGVKYGLVKVGTSAHKGTVNFSASRFL